MIFWSQELQAYVNENGEVIAWGNDGQVHEGNDTIAAIVSEIIFLTIAALRALAVQLQIGGITVSEFSLSSIVALKDMHASIGTLTMGGVYNVSQNDLKQIENILQGQFGYFQGLVDDIISGRQKLDGSLMRRLDMYGNAGWGTFIGLMGYMAVTYGGKTQERRILGAADHCRDCLDWARVGWQPIGTLPPIGASVCKTNCHCAFEYK